MLTLGVQDIVVLKDVLSGFEEVILDSFLRLLNHLAEESSVDLFHWRPCLQHRVLQHVRVKDLPKLVFKRNIKLRFTWVALSSSASTELVIDSSRLVSFGTQNKQ